jgi:hypothetical protein
MLSAIKTSPQGRGLVVNAVAHPARLRAAPASAAPFPPAHMRPAGAAEPQSLGGSSWTYLCRQPGTVGGEDMSGGSDDATNENPRHMAVAGLCPASNLRGNTIRTPIRLVTTVKEY